MTKNDLNNLVTVADLNNFSDAIIGEIHKLATKGQPEFYTPVQFSKITGMPYTTIIHYCKTNSIRARQRSKGSPWQILASEVNRFTEEAKNNLIN